MPGGLPTRTSRALLDIEDDKIIPVLRNPTVQRGQAGGGFHLPRCGPEPLFSQGGPATPAMLYHGGTTTMPPPGYLCCGYPQTSAGFEDKGLQITTDNRVLFH